VLSVFFKTYSHKTEMSGDTAHDELLKIWRNKDSKFKFVESDEKF